uniref:UBC core domain-containing protein n=1 Tax=Eutreptiella gymnastica TaxID=73025 RepID=A0A7S4G8F0_9EUGL
MQDSPCREFVAQPLEDNVFEWLFTLRGPDETEYENGFYRGRLILQSNYPFSPPDVELLTPNGRFELNKKICLSISSYHPENWKPTWGIKTVLHALREFMSTPGNNAIGAIEYSKERRKHLAQESHHFECPVLKVPIADDIELMNNSPATVVTEKVPSSTDSTAQGAAAPTDPTPKSPEVTPKSPEVVPKSPEVAPADQPLGTAPAPETLPPDQETTPAAQPDAPAADAAPAQPAAAAPAAPAAPARPANARTEGHGPVIVIQESTINNCIVVVVVAILAILAKKAYQGEWHMHLLALRP